jgi:hypothetical protein
MLCCLEASLSSCGPATKSRTLGLWLTPYPLGLRAWQARPVPEPDPNPTQRRHAEPDRVPAERLAELVSAAAYGTVLVLAALSVISVSDVALGHGSELVAGVGAATFVAHLFAELLGDHIRRDEPLSAREVRRAVVDGSPILAATVLPALVLLVGRLDLISATTARVVSVLVAVIQLVAIGAYVGRVAPGRSAAPWAFAAVTAAVGLLVVVLSVLLGH